MTMITLQGKHRLMWILVELIFLVQVVSSEYFCEETWQTNHENGLCYKFFPESLSWKQARESCTREAGFLLSIRDASEQQFITNNVLSDISSVWSGGHSTYGQGWVWDNYKTPFNFTNWKFGPPKDIPQCLSLSDLSGYGWLAENCSLHRAYTCEKPAQVLQCDGTPNTVHLQPNELTTVSFPPFYDPLKPFKLPPYQKNLNCVWNIVPPAGYKIVMEYYPFCNDNLQLFQGNSLLENVSCREHFGNFVAKKPLYLSFVSDSFTKPRSEQGFQLRLFATNIQGSPCDEKGLPLVASPEKKFIASPGFPLQRPLFCLWTIFSPVKDARIYVQLKYLFLSEKTFLQIQNDTFTNSVILEKSGLLTYADERITLNYTSNDSYTGHHGFVLEYYIDKRSVSVCTQKHIPRELSQYGIPNPHQKYIVFSVKAETSEVEVKLATEKQDRYYVTFDPNDRRVCLRKTANLTLCLEEFSGELLKKDQFQDFWMSWFDTLKVGRGRTPGNDIILDYRINISLNITSVTIQSVNGTGEWKFYGPAFETDFVEVCHVSGTPEKPLWELQLPPRNQRHVTFTVRLCASGLLTFQTTNGSSYRIWLDAAALNQSNRPLSCFTAYESTNNIYTCLSTVSYERVLNCTAFKPFWISWENGKDIQIGKGTLLGRNVMASLKLGYIPVSSSFKFGSPVPDHKYDGSIWRFFGTPSNLDVINITGSQVVPSMTEVEGSTLTMSVEINIRFGFEVKWYRNGTRITQSPGRFLIQQTFIDAMICSLTILELKLRDEANWTVVISNQNSNAARSFDIKVRTGLQLHISPRYRFAVERGSSLQLVCNITNLEKLSGITVDVSLLIWYKDSRPLQIDGRRVSITTKSSYSQLQISAVDNDDAGTYSCNHDKYRVSMVINAILNVYNKGEVVCPSTKDVYGIQWPVNIPETMTHADCPNGKQGNASRFCDFSGTWQKTRVSYCADAELSNALNELQILDNDGVSDTDYIEQTFNNSLTKTENLTSSEETVSSANILSSINIIDTVLKVANQSNATVPGQNVYNIVDHVTSARNKDSWKLVEEETYRGPVSVLEMMEKTSAILMKDATLKDFRGENIVVNISVASLQDSGIQFLENDSFIVLPKQDHQNQVTKYSAVLYKTMSQLLPSASNTSRSKPDSLINSVVMSLTFEQPLQELSPPLELTFQHNKGVKTAGDEADCVFWDYALFEGSGGWSSEGCFTNSTAGGATVCLCNHTTNFAILMRPYTPGKEDSALVVISIVGCVISMLFTALTVGVYIYLWKKIKSDQNVLILCLCVSLFLAYLILLTGVDNAQDEVLCIVMTALLHFFLLLTFFMMLGVGTYFFMNVTVLFYAMHITNKFNSRSRLKWIAGSATGIPLIIVLITLGSCWNTQYHSEAFCWLSVNSGAIYAFIAPVLLIFLLNLGIIVSLLRVMFLTTKMKKADMKDKVRNALKSVCTLIPVLGVTWIFGIFAINEDLIAFQYIFTIANSIQGLLIFITHVFLNNKIKKTLRSKHPSLKRKQDKDKDVDHVMSSSSDQLTSNTHTTALVPVNQTVYKDPDKASVRDIHLETEETSSETNKTNYVMERVKFLSSMETKIVGGKIVSQSAPSTQILRDSQEGAFESKFSAAGVKNDKQDLKWEGGFVINNIKPEGSRAAEIRITKEIRVQHTNIERSRVVTSNTSQISTVTNQALQSNVSFSQLSNTEEAEFEA